ncbi:MAG: HD domain-containing protein [Planctomycetaceae bacterium]
MPYSHMVERAMRVAARWHRDQSRKASDLPYITHPASVTSLLCQAGIHDESILSAALLHDVVEDTPCTLQELAGEFPPRVIDYVSQLTERKRTDDGRARPWKDRKLDYIRHLEEAPWEVRAISLADKLHNLGSMVFDLESGETLWSRFGATPEEVLWYHDEVVRSAEGNEPQLNGLADECRRLIGVLRTSLTVKSA